MYLLGSWNYKQASCINNSNEMTPNRLVLSEFQNLLFTSGNPSPLAGQHRNGKSGHNNGIHRLWTRQIVSCTCLKIVLRGTYSRKSNTNTNAVVQSMGWIHSSNVSGNQMKVTFSKILKKLRMTWSIFPKYTQKTLHSSPLKGELRSVICGYIIWSISCTCHCHSVHVISCYNKLYYEELWLYWYINAKHMQLVIKQWGFMNPLHLLFDLVIHNKSPFIVKQCWYGCKSYSNKPHSLKQFKNCIIKIKHRPYNKGQ